MEILPADWGGSRVAADAVLPPSKSMADSYLPTGKSKLNLKVEKQKRYCFSELQSNYQYRVRTLSNY